MGLFEELWGFLMERVKLEVTLAAQCWEKWIFQKLSAADLCKLLRTTLNGRTLTTVSQPLGTETLIAILVITSIVRNQECCAKIFSFSSALVHLIGIYLAESEQRSCALAAATCIEGILCRAAGGYLIEQLPGAETETLKKVEANLAVLVAKDGGTKLPTNLLLNGVTPLEIAEIVLQGLDMQPLQQLTPKFVCECSEDRLLRALRLLPREDVDSILEKQEMVEARCDFCGKVYRMGPDEVRKRIEKAKGDPALDSDFENL